MFSHVDKNALHRRRELIKLKNEKANKKCLKTFWVIRRQSLL